MNRTAIEGDATLDRDIAVKMRDGAQLMVNVVSHRELDCARTRPGRPWHAHRRSQPVKPREIVPVEVEILASSTLFEEGSSLSIDVLGQDADRYPAFRHGRTVNRGPHTIHTGGRFDSHLFAPVVTVGSH